MWQWPIRSRPYFHDLHLCHLVVNVYKHGACPSFREFNELAPGLVSKTEDLPGFFLSALDYTDLQLSDDDLERFATAITAFRRHDHEKERTRLSKGNSVSVREDSGVLL